MSKIALGVVVIAAALAACSGKSDHSAASASAGSTPSTTTASTNETGTGTNTSGTATASASTADTSPSPAAAIGAPTPTPAAAVDGPGDASANAGSATTTAQDSTTAMGAAPAGGKGQQVFSQTCVACHGAGVAGAPKVGDKAEWGPRIAQGKQTLYQHAINGFQGKKGVMPPKGGNTTLADADVRAAVDYMVAQAK